ncbi:hypothetical protein JAAARDRAFT_126502 [Jaapia argillacea MUCL 33604]|uniref:Major facilitator superfamily (MFS) profile domain-containing protein n=1 Tax=Jaapia argillacea MUCL 33604 TaxID=933084 RepID=A0A067PYJ8_9AGAM|nr:hypothetical protein JAAARDRAFT_126502 [Jaapia argillacea MUCL 33604]
MLTADEESPLLSTTEIDHNAIYNRFTSSQKRIIVAQVSWAGLIPLFVSGSFVPMIPQIAQEFDSTGPIISLAVSLSILAAAVGSLIWATYSGYYGRRPIYLASLPIYCFGSLGVAVAHTVPELMAWRVIQSLGASSALSVGAGVIGDIYKLEERGAAMGVFFGACLLGPAIAPIAGGVAAHLSSWRDMQYALFLAGVFGFFTMFAFLPETMAPGSRGFEKYLQVSAEDEGQPSQPWLWLEAFKSLSLLRSPNILAITIARSCVLMTDYFLLIPLSYTIGERYGISNEILIGACFLPAGVGNIIGSPLAGHISDKVVVKWRKRRGGVWVPEDRLRATLSGGLILVPMSILLSGLVTQFIEGRLGLILNLVCLFVNGIGIDFVLSPSSAYYIDVMHSQSAQVMAASGAVQSTFIAVTSTAILPLINTIGVAGTDALAAFVGWIGFVLIYLTIRYGEQMRAWADVGYSTAQTN